MNRETEKTEQLAKIYREDPVTDNLKALVHQLTKTMFIVPATVAPDVDKEEVKRLAEEGPASQAKLLEVAKPFPCLLRNGDGINYFPMYTSQKQIGEEQKYDLLVTVTFATCRSMAENPNLKVEGIVLNPFTDNLILKKELLEALKKEDALRAAGAKEVRVTPQQFKVMMRQRAEFHELPFRIHKEGETFIQELEDKQEVLVNEIFKNAYQKADLYPYGEEDFAVMSLNLRDDVLLVRIDLPAIKDNAQLCYRVYVTMNPKTKEVRYFTIEQGKEKEQKNIGEVTSEGKHIEHGEAPVEGAEIQRIMDLLDGEKSVTS